MYNWAGKKLLVLGATRFIAEIVLAAKKYGAYVIAVDYNEDAPAKRIADESVLLNCMDVDAIVKYIKKNNIDGVMTGFTDSLMMPYFEICKKSGLPCYLTKELIDLTTDKETFKQLCNKFDIPTISEYKTNENIKFPVIIKPVDNSGARGIYVCKSYDDYKKYIDIAKSFSKSGKIIIEPYLDFQEATAFYVFNQGMPYFAALADRHMMNVRDGILRLPTGYTFPSKGTNLFIKNTDEKFKKLFDFIGIKDGMMFVQGFLDGNNNFIPYECGYRLTGSLEYSLMERVCGYNPMCMMINFALTGNMGEKKDFDLINPHFKYKSYNLTVLIRPGKISKIIGADKIASLPNVVNCYISYEQGDGLKEECWGRLSQAGARILFVADTDKEYKDTIDFIKENLIIVDENGNDMMLNKEIIK